MQLALFLLHERGLAQSGNANRSSHSGYVLSLPAEPLLPLVWTEEELRWLDGTQLLDTLLSYR